MSEKDIRILVVDDEEGMCKLLKSILMGEGYEVSVSTSPKKALGMLQGGHFDIVIADIMMPEMDGLEFLKNSLGMKPDTHYIMITAYGSIGNAVEAMRIGAFDYITKPFQGDEIRIAVKQVIDHIRLIDENLRLRREVEILQSAGNVQATSRKMLEIFAFSRKISDSNLSVLITGESGTGKEVIARYIHDISERRVHPFVPVQCSLLPVSLLESELFGFKKGSFTGATENRSGLFEQANNGTIFLDEIGDIGIDIQGKLLRFLQDREIRKIGDNKSMSLNVRLVSATNKNLEELIKEKEFREDLYFRLKVLTIHMPPLRERREDIPMLVRTFLDQINRDRKNPAEIDGDVIRYLMNYDWPGNVRELKNCIESAAAVCENDRIMPDDIRGILTVQSSTEFPVNISLKEAKIKLIEDFEKNFLINMMKKHSGNIAAASRDSQVDRKNFWQLLKKYGIDTGDYKE